MEARPLYLRGRIWKLYILADGEREFAREFVSRDLTGAQQTQIRNLLTRMADHPDLFANDRVCRRLHGDPNLAEFKRPGVRLLFFFDGPGRIVITHEFKKKADRTPPEEIDRAVRLRQAYLREKGERRER